MRGNNLPGFLARQLEFAAHIRDPEGSPAPADVDPQRMQVYVDLFFNNLEALLAGTFPVAKRVLGDSAWRGLVRSFMQRHPSSTPYFPEISQEFLEFLDGVRDPGWPGFLVELCHYEWVELALAIAEDPELPEGLDPEGDLMECQVVPSPLAWPLSYAYPVHRVGPGYEPDAPGERPVHLVVYRRGDQVRFMEVNALTQRLLQVLDGTVNGRQALARLAEAWPGVPFAELEEPGRQILERLRESGIVLGALPPLERLE